MNRSKISRSAGWLLSVLISLFLIGASAMGKFTQWEGKAEMFAKMGWTEDVMVKIGIVEVVIAILFMIPRTSFVAAILLAALRRCCRDSCSCWRPILFPHHHRSSCMGRTRTSTA
ncbi:MAG: DoxX family protein [Pirellulaceae bacterium]